MEEGDLIYYKVFSAKILKQDEISFKDNDYHFIGNNSSWLNEGTN